MSLFFQCRKLRRRCHHLFGAEFGGADPPHCRQYSDPHRQIRRRYSLPRHDDHSGIAAADTRLETGGPCHRYKSFELKRTWFCRNKKPFLVVCQCFTSKNEDSLPRIELGPQAWLWLLEREHRPKRPPGHSGNSKCAQIFAFY